MPFSINLKLSGRFLALAILVSWTNLAAAQGFGSLRLNTRYRTETKEWIEVDTFQMQLYWLHGDSLVRSMFITESRAQLNSLNPGVYTLVCTSEKYGSVEQEIVISGDRIRFADVDFTPRKKRRKSKK